MDKVGFLLGLSLTLNYHSSGSQEQGKVIPLWGWNLFFFGKIDQKLIILSQEEKFVWQQFSQNQNKKVMFNFIKPIKISILFKVHTKVGFVNQMDQKATKYNFFLI